MYRNQTRTVSHGARGIQGACELSAIPVGSSDRLKGLESSRTAGCVALEDHISPGIALPVVQG